jgi:Protein of unknown function (DUF1761)
MNPVAIVVAGVVYWLLQAGWYTVFQQQWIVGTGRSVADLHQGPMWVPLVISFIADQAVACGVAWAVSLTGEHTVARGVQTGIYLWVFFVATQLATNYTFENRSMTFFLINAGSALVGMIVIGAIVGAWRVKALARSAAS